MRSMEEDCCGDLSEDEQPSTDASEDSVDVSVRPVASFPSNLSRLPRKFRKAFEKTTSFVPQGSTNTVKTERTSPVGVIVHTKDRDDTPPQTTASPVTFSVITTGRASPPATLSDPSVTPRARGNKRKLLEPRKVIDASSAPDDDWMPRKAQRVEPPLLSSASSSSQSLLRHNPFISHLVPPQLLVSQTVWNPVAAQYPYSHLVGLAPQLGFLPPSSYPLLPLLPPRLPLVVPPKPPSGEVNRKNERPPKESPSSSWMNGVPDSLLRISAEEAQRHSPPPHDDTVQDSHRSHPPFTALKKSPAKTFLSVESLLSSSTTRQVPPSPSLSDAPPTLAPQFDPLDDDQDLESTEGTIQSLLQHQPKQKQRNYKNMTRERRIEANARERTRVHTISAAFETLRQAVPSFSHNQKLSKLSVLRIASSYILSLSRLAGSDYSQNQSSPTFEECVDLTTKTIQIEGKAKKKRDE